VGFLGGFIVFVLFDGLGFCLLEKDFVRSVR
jgi:hypothetical protein